MSDFEHLIPAMAEKSRSMSDQERKAWLDTPRWLTYTRAKEIDAKLEWLYGHPRVTRMPNMLLIGRTNNGKTDLITRFASRHPPCDNPSGEHINVPVLIVQTPPKPTEAGFYMELVRPMLKRLPNGSADTKRAFVVGLLKDIQLKVLVIDEMHNMLSGTAQSQHLFLNVIKYLTNDLQISIIGVGDQTLINAISVDEQLQNRFEPEILPRWDRGKEFSRLLSSFELILPLRHPSHLVDPLLSMKILSICEGTIGELSKLLNAATRYAIDSGIEQINDVVLTKCAYRPPSERKKAILEV
ncbi:TniB family NTP-binding protein [Pseudomonas guariconensis]|uniref:TniB family NTP-binding protein n=1 Tax=Pseudomonas guariconensis TaxID=1288410 RepID=UPI0039E81A42